MEATPDHQCPWPAIRLCGLRRADLQESTEILPRPPTLAGVRCHRPQASLATTHTCLERATNQLAAHVGADEIDARRRIARRVGLLFCAEVPPLSSSPRKVSGESADAIKWITFFRPSLSIRRSLSPISKLRSYFDH